MPFKQVDLFPPDEKEGGDQKKVPPLGDEKPKEQGEEAVAQLPPLSEWFPSARRGSGGCNRAPRK